MTGIITRKFPITGNVLEVAKYGKPFTSIQTAINTAAANDHIIIYPGTYNENVTIATAGITISGIDKKKTFIDSITITGKDVVLSNISVSGNSTIVCTVTYDWGKWIEVSDCDLYGNVNLGTTETACSYKVRLLRVFIYGDSTKTLVQNFADSTWSHAVDCSMDSGKWGTRDSITYSVYRGRLDWYNCKNIIIGTLQYVNNNIWSLAHFEQCDLRINILSTSASNTSNTHILAIRQCHALAPKDQTWTFDGRFEFDVQQSLFWYPAIVFNSTANSRIQHVTGCWYQNANTITGTGLANLYIHQSLFHCAAPVGLGEDMNNSWEAFVDD